MPQGTSEEPSGVGPLSGSVGYTLKQVTSALRGAMDQALVPLDLTVSQYSCLEQLGQNPGLSSAELARGLFVSRQSTNLVLRGLQERGLLARPDVVEQGRARPTELTDAGAALVRRASRAVRDVETQMLSLLDAAGQERLLGDLQSCARALAAPDAGE